MEVMEEDFNINRNEATIVGSSRDTVGRIGTTLKNEIIQEVKVFSYLGFNITRDRNCCREIVSRIIQAKMDLIKR